MKKYNDLKVHYIPFKCVAINFPHYELAYKDKKGNICNLFCLFDMAQNKEGIKLLKEMVKKYNESHVSDRNLKTVVRALKPILK